MKACSAVFCFFDGADMWAAHFQPMEFIDGNLYEVKVMKLPDDMNQDAIRDIIVAGDFEEFTSPTCNVARAAEFTKKTIELNSNI